MVTFLSSLDSTLTTILVIIGIFIIVSGAVKTLWEFIRYKTKRNEQENGTGESRQFPLVRSHLTISIILAIPLFVIKLLDDAVRVQALSTYISTFSCGNTRHHDFFLSSK